LGLLLRTKSGEGQRFEHTVAHCLTRKPWLPAHQHMRHLPPRPMTTNNWLIDAVHSRIEFSAPRIVISKDFGRHGTRRSRRVVCWWVIASTSSSMFEQSRR